ncbi:MAG TPA: ABC transporter substrate-binding protein [Phycisphaeraceae bacterium]|nr:ABC transporter substrate-binding protein [Phycisphaeraceae bacterium]
MNSETARLHNGSITIQLGHSPDPDDAFMWWPLFELQGRPPVLDTAPFRFLPVMQDIQTLNERSLGADLEITALSMHQYPHVAQQYQLTACGASMGEKYGPKLVAREQLSPRDLRDTGRVIAVPGLQTTAFLVLSLLLGPGTFKAEPMPFETIIDAVASGRCDAGVIIHEGQLTFAHAGLVELADLGRWWYEKHQLPLPLGGNAIRRDLESIHGPGTLKRITALLEKSIRYAGQHRQQGLEYALGYARDMTVEQVDRFVEMYVNDLTIDPGEQGLRAIQTLLREAAQAGLSPDPGEVVLLRAGG